MSTGKDLSPSDLKRRIEEIKRQRQKISDDIARENELLASSVVPPEPEIMQKINTKSTKLTLTKHDDIESVEVEPTRKTHKQQRVEKFQIIRLDPEPVIEKVGIEKPAVKIEIDDSSCNAYDFIETAAAETKEAAANLDLSSVDVYDTFWSTGLSKKLYPCCIDWSGKEEFAVASNSLAHDEGIVQIYNINDLDHPTSLKFKGQPSVVKFAPNSRDIAVVGGMTGSVYLYDRRKGNQPIYETKRWEVSHYCQVVSVVFTSEYSIKTIDSEGNIYSWSDRLVLDQKTVNEHQMKKSTKLVKVTCASLGHHNTVVLGRENGTVITENGDEICDLKSPITGIDFAKGRLAVASYGGSARLMRDRAVFKAIDFPVENFTCCCWKPESSSLAISSDRVVKLYNFDDDTYRTIDIGGGQTCLGFNSDGSIMSVGMVDDAERIKLIRCQ